jgi:hypothetical protein
VEGRRGWTERLREERLESWTPEVRDRRGLNAGTPGVKELGLGPLGLREEAGIWTQG